MRYLFLIAFLLSAGVACNKPEPNPENQDRIYQDLLSELTETQKKAAEVEASVQDYQKKLSEVVPQTGQIHYVQKRTFDSQNQLDRLQQQIKYWTLRSESRRDYVRRKSLQAFYKGEKWSDEKEYNDYMTQKRMFHARTQWNARERREEFLQQEAKAKRSVAGSEESAGGEGAKSGEGEEKK